MITARVYQCLSQRNVLPTLQSLKKIQYWPREKIRDYQFGKFKRLLQHAYEQVPYYQNLLSSLGATPGDFHNFDDLKKLPVLTKDLIRENAADLVAVSYKQDDLIPNSTGGSTGEPLHFYQDKNYEKWADAARIRGWYHLAGCGLGDTTAVLWGAMREVKQDFTFRERITDFLKSGEVWLNAFNLSEQRKSDFVKWCRMARPALLRGYVTAILDFARFVDENSISFPPIKGIILCAETVDSVTQSYVERVFKAPSFNTYGGRELSLIAMECPCKDGLHEVSENNYIEFDPVDISGYEDAGNLIVTNLNNYAMPFIRYQIGDIGVPSRTEHCGCGRGLPLISKVIGRTTEVFEFMDGTRIAGEMFIHLMKEFPMDEYQFIQKSDMSVVLRYKRSNRLNEEVLQKIRELYTRYLPHGVVLDFQAVDHIEKTQTGKFRFVLRDF